MRIIVLVIISLPPYSVICTGGCDVNNGYCTAEDECICLDGWMGPTCTDIACQAECLINGRCDQPYVCTCNSAEWSGDTCNVPRCIGCQNGMCTVPDQCVCIEGWSGDNCTVPECTNGCGNGTGQCVGPDMCQCSEGWSGDQCMDPVCDACVNGQCTAPATCQCVVGWLGDSCNQPICLEGCSTDYGSCELPGECNCKEGYFGELCDSTSATAGICKSFTCMLFIHFPLKPYFKGNRSAINLIYRISGNIGWH